jgi:hypothetical protein
MIVATVGSAVASDLGLSLAAAGEGGEGRLLFGELEPLVSLMQETPADTIVSTLVAKLQAGTDLKTVVSAAALANARTFGGEDYVGFHTLMALSPAYAMSRELPAEQQALPVLKVLHRNTNRIQEVGGASKEVLHPVAPADGFCCEDGGEALRDLVRTKDMDQAERAFAALAQGKPAEAFDALLYTVEDNTEVHRTVLPYRAWDLLALVGPEHAHTLLRQSVRYCVKSEREWNHSAEMDRPRVILPKLLEQYGLIGKALGARAVDDAWVEQTSRALFESSAEQAAEICAAALAEGISPDALGEAISLAANQLVLRDAGRRESEIQPNKPLGSVHGDSIGVHACDSANAWRNMARASGPRNTFACLILGAFQMAHDRVSRGGDFLNWKPRPHGDALEAVAKLDNPTVLLNELDQAIRSNEQERASALTHRLGALGQPARPVLDVLLRYAVSEDGALHAEKYYRTVSEEFGAIRPTFRWRQLVALSRVTASEYGRKAPGFEEACERLGVRMASSR